jgi:uncharacterized protein YggU (UPF0235/DUF167 family)
MQEYAVQVKPGSTKGPLVEVTATGALTIYVRQRALDGKANVAAIATLAKYFGVAKSRVTIVRGHTAHQKVVRVVSYS